jgi:hypothetical protein
MMKAPYDDNWGPWAKAIADAERVACLRCLAAYVQCLYGTNHPLFAALFWAESLEPEDMAAAFQALDGLPSRDRRKVEGTYGGMIAARAQLNARGR